MKATLYEALGISHVASPEEIRAALRGQIRKQYASTRDGQGNVEEALRFINHASCILTDSRRRALYDQELAISHKSVDQRIRHVVQGAMGRNGDKPVAATRDDDPSTHTHVRSPLAPSSTHPGLVERVGSLPHATSVAIAACASFVVLVAMAILFVTPADAVLVARQMLITLTVALTSLALIYGLVHASSMRRSGIRGHGVQSMYDERLVLTWRRERTVFFGSNPPQEDAGWIFKLRMAELERAKVARTSHSRPWNRLGARLFDYAVWGLTLAFVVGQLHAIGAVPASLVHWLMHPLLAAILICATWMPAEALFNAYARTTPGKWLFGVYLQYAISDAYAGRDPHAQLKRAVRRAFHVWWRGMGCAIPVLSPVIMAIAYERLVREQETPWDAAEDCLVTHAPPSSLNTATGIAGLVAMLWLYGVVWQPAMQDSITTARSSVIAVLPPSTLFSPASLSRGMGTINDAVHEARTLGLQHSLVRSVADSAAPSADRSGNDPKIAASPPIDPDLARLFADRRARIHYLRSEGLRMLDSHNWRRAKDLCQAWVDLDYGNSEAWRCVGEALQHEGQHQEAVNALRKAKQFDPDDRTLDAAISRSQHAIVAQFLSTAR